MVYRANGGSNAQLPGGACGQLKATLQRRLGAGSHGHELLTADM